MKTCVVYKLPRNTVFPQENVIKSCQKYVPRNGTSRGVDLTKGQAHDKVIMITAQMIERDSKISRRKKGTRSVIFVVRKVT